MNKDTSSNNLYCSKCGKPVTKGDKFCVNCGNKLITIEDTFKNTTENIKDVITNNETFKNFTDNNYDENLKSDFENKDMINFIQNKTEYYIPKFKEMQDVYKTTSWNWAAFFFNSWWFIYRKMYLVGIGIIGINLLLSAIVPSISWILSIAIPILSGIYGNNIYLKHIKKELEPLCNVEPNMKEAIIRNKGGVNVVIPIILAVVTVILTAIVLGVIGAAYYYISLPWYY